MTESCPLASLTLPCAYCGVLLSRAICSAVACTVTVSLGPVASRSRLTSAWYSRDTYARSMVLVSPGWTSVAIRSRLATALT